MLAKLREICKYLAGACNSNNHAVGYTVLLLSAKQGREINAMRRVVSENVSKELSVTVSIRFECEEVSLQIEFTTLPPKNHNLFVKIGAKRELEKKELRPQANNAQYNTQGKVGGGGVRRRGGGGGRAGPVKKNIYWPGLKL